MNEDEVTTNENQEVVADETTDVSPDSPPDKAEGQSPLKNTFESSGQPLADYDIQAVYDVPVQVSAVIGRTTMPVHQLLKLGHGAVVELDRRVGEAIDIYVNNRLIARGELIVIDDRVGVTMTKIIKYEQ